MTVADNTPLLVGIGAVQQKTTDLTKAKEPIALMIDAVKIALADCQAPEIASDIQRITVPKGLWAYTNPAALIAKEIGSQHCHTEFADFGILQQTNLSDACRDIANGDIDCAMVVGGEAKFRQLQAAIQGIEISDTEQLDSKPDTFLQPKAELWSEIESNTGLGMAVGFYALLESAICHASGQTLDQHRDAIAKTYARFSEIAAANPDAWSDEAVSVEYIRNGSAKNKMLAFPYTKLHNSQWNVDQACALIFCSAKKARALKIPEEKWVFPIASTESNQMLNVSQRPDLANSAGAKIAGLRALEIAGRSIDDMDFIELYSCFPAAVNLYVKALDIPADRDLTVGGAMPFAGGPLNNFFLQATVKLAKKLREKPGSYALASCVSGMFTKQGYGIWSSAPGDQPFGFADVSEEVCAAEKPVALIEPSEGKVRIIATTVLYEGLDAKKLVAVCEYDNGIRTASFSDQPNDLQAGIERNLVGETATINQEGQLRL